MKKKIFVLIGLLFILVIFWGCEEGIVDPSPLETPKYTIKIGAHGSGGEITPSGNVPVSKGEALKISVSKETGVDVTATLDGKDLPLQRSKVDKSYFFRVSDITANAVVDVNFEKGIRYKLAQNPLEYYSREIRLLKTNEYLYTAYVPRDVAYSKMYFDEDSLRDYDVNNKLIGLYSYKIIEPDTILIGKDHKLKIVNFDNSKLTTSSPSKAYNMDVIDPNTGEALRTPEKDELFIETWNIVKK